MFYGDKVRWFIGTVLSTNDPHSRGRVQILIHGLHSTNPNDISNTDFPWAECMLPTTEGGASGVGKIPGIVESARVFGFFADGQVSQTPIVLGSLTHVEGPTASQIAAAAETRNAGAFIPGNYGPHGIVITEQMRQQYSLQSTSIDAKRMLIMRFLLQQVRNGRPLFTVEQAAGITGNLEGENGQFDPTVKAQGDEPSYGLAQWNFNAGRGQYLQRFSQNIGGGENDWLDFWVQLKFLIHELVGKPGAGDGGSTYRSAYDAIAKADKFDGYPNGGYFKKANATWIFMDLYENPAAKYDKIGQRQKFARKAYQQYISQLAAAKPVDPGGVQ